MQSIRNFQDLNSKKVITVTTKAEQQLRNLFNEEKLQNNNTKKLMELILS